MINIDDLFNSTIEELKKGSRPRHIYNEEQVKYLVEAWENSLSNDPEPIQQLSQILCLVEHAHGDSSQWQQIIIKTLDSHQSEEIIIMTLGVSHRQILNRQMRRGERVPMEFIQCFYKLLEHENPEVLEWTLRTIEQMGAQSVLLKEKVLARKPGIMRIFNKHLKYGHEIIEILERRWSPYSN